MGDLTRRGFLKGSAKTIMGVALATSWLPLVTAGCSSKSSVPGSLVNLGPIDEVTKGPFPKKINYKTTIEDGWTDRDIEGFVYVTKGIKRDIIVMSPVCTHLGCTVPLADESKRSEEVTFLCPCHGGEYNQAGINTGGPPPRPLDLFGVVEKEENLYVDIVSPIKRVEN
ncbi:ubiquinol-cytochrome c reductase iron-sulfur subunit [Pseudalkalibacillus caeni]|uniref:Ubiquinol-cytochrome c reductase iron-sulfur subunit n=1 Tax=Exobacillus caeni TaxID=2574798 RepID=A0A5R9FH66_9BACL|nr:ubiquinol-cytochrome c reductase iron-sulfur subunit [Pseudalkalibacillus caeni]TLS38895.1 ubiquinol-cytochrome c reductase iron-sulfur subunit [Pseudalkalibacillus caeni]